MKRSFGKALKLYRRDCRDPEYGGMLTQERLAELLSARTDDASYPSASTLAYWEADKNLPDAFKRRDALIALIGLFAELGPLKTTREANQFLAAGGYAALSEEECIAIWGKNAKGADVAPAPEVPLRQLAPVYRGDSPDAGERPLVNPTSAEIAKRVR